MKQEKLGKESAKCMCSVVVLLIKTHRLHSVWKSIPDATVYV